MPAPLPLPLPLALPSELGGGSADATNASAIARTKGWTRGMTDASTGTAVTSRMPPRSGFAPSALLPLTLPLAVQLGTAANAAARAAICCRYSVIAFMFRAAVDGVAGTVDTAVVSGDDAVVRLPVGTALELNDEVTGTDGTGIVIADGGCGDSDSGSVRLGTIGDESPAGTAVVDALAWSWSWS